MKSIPKANIKNRSGRPEIASGKIKVAQIRAETTTGVRVILRGNTKMFT
jgi:hypothetical protein